MAGEITISGRLGVTKGNLQFSFQPSTLQADMAGETGAGGEQVIGNTAEALSLNADVTPYGFAFFRNLSTTIPIEIGVTAYTNQSVSAPTAMVSTRRLLAGEYTIDRVATTAIYAKAITSGTNTAATLQFHIFSP
jgi:hypothetical protein